MPNAVGFPKHVEILKITTWYLQDCKQPVQQGSHQNGCIKKQELMHDISKNVCESFLEVFALILTAISGRGLKKGFGAMRGKQKERPDEYP